MTTSASLGGSGLGTTIVGAFLKRRFDRQIETHKALLSRTGKIHEKQVDALLGIHAKLDEALFYMQRVAAAGKLEGEAPDDELLKRAGESLAEASKQVTQNRLLLSESLGKKLDEFFNKMLSGRMTLGLALTAVPQNPSTRAQWWDQARNTMYTDVPALLKAIRDEARTVIHG